MVTANPHLSNIFLHNGQGVDKSGKTGGVVCPEGDESLEEATDWYFNFRARVKRQRRGFLTAGRDRHEASALCPTYALRCALPKGASRARSD
jgi:hypothetical protein